MLIKKGDSVLIITGKDSGKIGTVLEVLPDKNKVLVENVNMIKRHTKPRNAQEKGGIITKNAPIDASNVMIVCPVCGKATRVAHAEKDGKKIRICKKCSGSLDKAYVKESKKEVKKQMKQSNEEKAPVKKTTKVAKTTEKIVSDEKKVAVKKKTQAKVVKETADKKTTSKSTTKKSVKSNETK